MSPPPGAQPTPKLGEETLSTLLSPEDVARLCGYSRKAIYRAIERGELRATKRCSRWRLWPDDVHRWLEAGVPTLGDSEAGGREPKTGARRPDGAPARGSLTALLREERGASDAA